MTRAEFKAWETLTAGSRDLWTEDVVTSRNQKCDFYYRGGVDGVYMKIGKDGSFAAGTYEGAYPHIGDQRDVGSSFTHEQHNNYDAAFQRALEIGGKQFLVDMFRGADHAAVADAVRKAYAAEEPAKISVLDAIAADRETPSGQRKTSKHREEGER